MKTNYLIFEETLEEQYKDLFANNPEYSYSASKVTPNQLAARMTHGLLKGSANKDGSGIKRTCKKLNIKYTYKAILEYLKGD
jgi:hypothetical protein